MSFRIINNKECLFNHNFTINPVLEFIDLVSGLAKYSFGSQFKTVNITIYYKAVVGNEIVNSNVSTTTDSDGSVTFPIPLSTNCIKITFKIKKSCYLLTNVQYYPENNKEMLENTDLNLRLLIEKCIEFAYNTSGLDHVQPQPHETRVQHQIGPCKASRALAMVAIAIFECIIAVRSQSDPDYQSYLGDIPILECNDCEATLESAIVQATYATLLHLFPSHLTYLNEFKNNYNENSGGISLGNLVANSVISKRQNDNSELSYPEPNYSGMFVMGQWSPDPISGLQVALGKNWSQVVPFAIESSSVFRAPPYPELNTPEYRTAYEEAKSMGGDGITTPTVRSQHETEIGIFWAYDGTPSLCAPPRLYNQIAIQLGREQGLNAVETARMLALVNISLADAGIACWETKYHYNFWRPVTGIRTDDLVPETVTDSNYTPLGAPASNSDGVDFTPPFPSYVSGHGTFGSALFQTLRNIFGKDNIPFTFVSDEYNGITQDSNGNTRELKPRHFNNLSHAEYENAKSRVYLGIHWNFDATEAIIMGRKVADDVFSKVYVN
jgi:hypothetical protein